MDPGEVMGYALHGAIWCAVGGISYISALVGLQTLPRYLTERIETQDDLERMVFEESQELKLDVPIVPVLKNYHIEEVLVDDDGFDLKLGGFGAYRSVVRHELYHIYKQHHEHPWRQGNNFQFTLNYLFREEPQAVAYQVFGIRL